jgi:rhodanese-related sulfurtransferase
MNTVWKGAGCKIVEGYIRRCNAYLIVALLAFVSVVCAEETIAPESIAGVTRVDAEGVLTLVEKMPRLVIIDSRITMDRKQGYLEGSVSLPDTETNCAALARIIPEKDRLALFYCNGVKCGRSAVAVKTARQCGYTRLYWYRGGFEDWKQKNYPYLKK